MSHRPGSTLFDGGIGDILYPGGTVGTGFQGGLGGSGNPFSSSFFEGGEDFSFDFPFDASIPNNELLEGGLDTSDLFDIFFGGGFPGIFTGGLGGNEGPDRPDISKLPSGIPDLNPRAGDPQDPRGLGNDGPTESDPNNLPNTGDTSGLFGGLFDPNGPLGQVLGGVDTGLDIFERIAGFFRDDGSGQNSERAAALQQNIETAALNIYQQFQDGTLDHDSALKALQQLQMFVGSIASGGSGADLTRAGQMSNLIITSVMAQVQSSRTTALQDPFNTPNAIKTGIGNTQPPSGSSSFQSDRLKSGLRDFLIGTEGGIGDSLRSEGGPQGDDPSFAEILTRNNSVTNPERLGQFTAQVEGLFPTNSAENFGGFRTRLRDLQDERLA